MNKLPLFKHLDPQIRKLFLISLGLHLTAAWFSGGFYQFDEHFQILEYLHGKMSLRESEILPWEFKHQMRPGFQIYIYWCITSFLNIIGIKSPFIISFVLRLLTSVFGWFTLCKLTEISFKWFQSQSSRIFIATLSSLLWFFPYIHSRTSSENLSGSLFFLGIVFLLKEIKPEIKSPIRQTLPDNFSLITGLLLGLSFMTRYQVGLMILGLIIWTVFIARFSLKSILLITAGGLTGVFIGFMTDTWTYGEAVFTPWRYFYQNLIVGNSELFGNHPWWKYFYWLGRELPPLSTFLMACTLIAWGKFRSHILTWTTVPLLLVHLYFQNKATRFLFPIFPAVPILTYLGYSCFKGWIQENFKSVIKPAVILFWILNTSALLAVSLRAANRAYTFYKYVYSERSDLKEIHFAGESPYEMVAIPLEYYKHKDTKLIKHENFENIASVLKSGSSDELVVFSRKIHLDGALSKNSDVGCEMIYSTTPRWLLKFNVNNWVSRSRIWSLHRCKLLNRSTEIK